MSRFRILCLPFKSHILKLGKRPLHEAIAYSFVNVNENSPRNNTTGSQLQRSLWFGYSAEKTNFVASQFRVSQHLSASFSTTTKIEDEISHSNFGHESEILQLPDEQASFIWGAVNASLDSVSSVLDSIHEATGMPWWLTLISSTLVVRSALFPLVVMQARASAQLRALGPKLPPPFPLPNSTLTVRQTFRTYLEAKRKLGGPSLLWIFAPPAVQIPLFLLWISSLRRMALSGHPGFEQGGALWFMDLTSPAAASLLGLTLPAAIGVLYFTTLQISLRDIQKGVKSPAMALLLLGGKWTLEFFTLPLMYTALILPQGVHMYWLANNAFTLTQVLAMRWEPAKRALGILDAPAAPVKPRSLAFPGVEEHSLQGSVPVASSGAMAGRPVKRSLEDALLEAAQLTSQKQAEAAIAILQSTLASAGEQAEDSESKLSKDKEAAGLTGGEHSPAIVSVHLALGQLMSSARKDWALSRLHYQTALTLASPAASDARLFASLGLGIALANLGEKQQAIAVLAGAASVLTPAAPASTSLQFRRLVQLHITLASLLAGEGRKQEALEWLERVAGWEGAEQVEAIYAGPLREELRREEERLD